MKQHAIFLLASIILLSCGSQKDDGSEPASDTIAYTITSPARTTELVGLETDQTYGIVSQQSIQATFTLKNLTDRQLTIFPSTLTMSSAEGARSTAINATTDTLIISPGEPLQLEGTFLPINSRQLYHYAHLRGDIKSAYTVSVAGLSASGEYFEQEFQLLTDTLAHKKAVLRFGHEHKTTPYQLSGIVNAGTSPVVENVSMDEHLQTLVRDNEILRQGFWIKVMTYHQHDTVHCRLRFVNQSPDAIKISPDRLRLVTPSGVIEPFVRSKAEVILNKGDREEIDLKYRVPEKTSLEFDFRSIQKMQADSASVFDGLFSLQPLQLR